MKKTIIAAVLALGFSQIALAGSYSHAVSVQQYCTTSASWSADVYDGRVKGDSKQKYLDEAAGILADGDRSSQALRMSIDYAYDKAVNHKDAYMTAWGYCMDVSN